MRRPYIFVKFVCAVVLICFVTGCTRTVLRKQSFDYKKIELKGSKFIPASTELEINNKKIIVTELRENEWEIEQKYMEEERTFDLALYISRNGVWPFWGPIFSGAYLVGGLAGLDSDWIIESLYMATYPVSSILVVDNDMSPYQPHQTDMQSITTKIESLTIKEDVPVKEGTFVAVSNGRDEVNMGRTAPDGSVPIRPEVLNSLCRESHNSCRLSVSYQRENKGERIKTGEVTVGSELILWARRNNASYWEKEQELSVLMGNGALKKVKEFVDELKKDPIYEPIVMEGDHFVGRIQKLRMISFDGMTSPRSHPRSSRPFEAIQELTQKMVEYYLNLSRQIPSEIRKPQLPPPPKLVKGEFETKTVFEKRVNEALEERQKEIVRLQEQYRRDVEERNQKIEKLKDELESRKRKLPLKTVEFTHKAFYAVMGKPLLKKPVYDAESETMYVDFMASNAAYKKRVAIKIPLLKAKQFKSGMKFVQPRAIFELQKGSIVLKEITVGFQGTEYTAVLTDQDFKPEKVVVALKDEKVEFNADKLVLQNPNLIDSYQVSAISYGESSGVSGRKYHDDLAPLIKKCAQKKVDPKKWLFIIAIENYDGADKVIFAKNSAEAFKKTAQKVFGVGERNTYALIDEKATSGKVKDDLAYLMKNVKEGDTIYFYYSGHGVPDPDSNESFILPKDKVVDFISREEQFKLSNIYKQFTDSKASRIVAFVDACFSGKTDNTIIFKGVAPGLMRTKKVGFDKNKMVVMTAGRDTQFSNSFDEKGHRMFSYYLMKSLLTREHPDLDTVYKEVSVKVKDSSWAKGDVYLQEPQIDGKIELGM